MRIKTDDAVAFVIPMAMLIQINLVGTLLGSDLLSLGLVALYFVSESRRKELFGLPKVLLLAYAFWLLGAILTDIYRDTPFDDLARGWSKIVFFGLCVSALCMVSLGRLSVLRACLLGICAAWLVKSAFFPNDYILEYPWKFGYSQAITPLVAILASMPFIQRRFGLLGGAVSLLSIAAVNLMFDFRSMFGIAAAAGLFCVLKYALDVHPALRRRLSPASFAAIVLLGLGIAQGLISVYETAAGSGALGLDARDRYQTQSASDVGFLLSGRGEGLVSTQAIVDSPILGHGSWARDVTYVALLVDKLEELGLPIQGNVFANDLIPAHSHLLGSWVEAGIGGGLFWAIVLGLGIVGLYRTLKLDNAPTPFLAFFLIFMFWDVLFSPFGQEQRFLIASKIAITLWVLRQPVAVAPIAPSRS